MFKKDKIALLLIPVVMVGMGFFMVTSGGEAQKALSAFVLHFSFLGEGSDGNSEPDYHFLYNQKDQSASAVKKDIVLPEALQMATENRCGFLIKKLDDAKMVDKFDAAYLIVCFDKYPALFTTFFNDLYPVAETVVVPKVETETFHGTTFTTEPTTPDTTEEETAL